MFPSHDRIVNEFILSLIKVSSTVSSTIAEASSSTSNLSNQVLVFLLSGLLKRALPTSKTSLAAPNPGIVLITAPTAALPTLSAFF